MVKIYNKNASIIVFGSIALLTACGGNPELSVDQIIAQGDLVAIREKRNILLSEQQERSNQLQLLDAAIADLSQEQYLPLVSTQMVQPTVFQHFIDLQGSVATREDVVVLSEMSGTLYQIVVTEGQSVSKGAVLAKIDDGGMTQRRAQLAIQMNLAKTSFEKQERLWNQGIGSEMQFLQAKANFEAQLEGLKQLDSQLKKTVITAPFSGVVDEIMAQQGSVVYPGQSPIMRIINLQNMYIEAEVPERHLSAITQGAKVEVFFPILNRSVNTTIKQVGQYINQANRTFKIEIAVPNLDGMIKPNLTGRIKISDYTKENALVVPLSVISENGNSEQFVYTIKKSEGEDKGVAERRVITTGLIQDGKIEVLSGLEPNAEIITEGARNVRAGQAVQVIYQ
ncbi:MAG: efflux RND transporter periplasmic adaptor subunit [Bacteroidetes bacterium]|jgi:membrane fusion protein, multidrug efflux system|nr:efflux RND transporter periplasmic adaptor subunit [Bacteroidota bacterium]MDA0879386.1 efflux RND transporter periplasmic adaptor subunit [Bacteroidota bacterium]MDA1114992.1 efflux RND transporter periplasmic adaptor subunit [Bacteroidota bacterium]